MTKLLGIFVTGLAAWAFTGLRYDDPEFVYHFYVLCLVIVAILFHYALRPLRL